MALVMPTWLDQVPHVDFSEEKRFLTQIQQRAKSEEWTASDGERLSDVLRARTDLLLRENGTDRTIRFAVLPKRKGRPGELVADFSNLVSAGFVQDPARSAWKLLISGVVVERDFLARMDESGWRWFVDLFFGE